MGTKFIIVLSLLFQIFSVGIFKVNVVERIINGQIAENGAFPFQVALLIDDNFICGGSIITVKYVLTAGHCVYHKEVNRVKIVTGTNRYKNEGQIYKATSIIIHPDYEPINEVNDIAIIFIKYGIILSNKVKIMTLTTSPPRTGSGVVIAGWGVTIFQSKNASLELRRLNCTIMSISECVGVLKGYPINNKMHICTVGRKNQGVCNGDAGSPLVQNNKQFGIVSWGLNCGYGYPDVYVNIAYYLPWLKKVTKNTVFT